MFLTESEEWADDHGEHVGYCRTHQQRVLDSCDQCDEEYGWLQCGECEEYRYEDARLEGGMKCGVCAYG